MQVTSGRVPGVHDMRIASTPGATVVLVVVGATVVVVTGAAVVVVVAGAVVVVVAGTSAAVEAAAATTGTGRSAGEVAAMAVPPMATAPTAARSRVRFTLIQLRRDLTNPAAVVARSEKSCDDS